MPGNRKTIRTNEELVPAPAMETAGAAPPAPPMPQPAGAVEVVLEEVLHRSVSVELFDASPPVAGNDYLLLIAIDHYTNPVLNLNNPVRDANALMEILCRRYRFSPKEYRQFNTDKERENHEQGTYMSMKEKEQSIGKERYKDAAADYRIYHNSDRIKCLYNEDANTDNIDTQLNNLIGKMEKDDRLLIYYSGHGYKKKNDLGEPLMLTTHNFDETKRSTYITVDDLTNKGNTEKCRNLLLIIDACYAGAAKFGNKHEDNKPFSREVLVSCSAVQLASDGSKYTGSPFSQVLVDTLADNPAIELKLAALTNQLKNKITLRQQGKVPEIADGTAPTFENGSETYRFRLANDRSPDIKLFAESIINYLNFSIERRYFIDEIKDNASQKNTNYFILSSITNNLKVEKLRGTVISKTFARTLRKEKEVKFQLKKFPLTLEWNMANVKEAQQIFDQLSTQKNVTGVGLEEKPGGSPVEITHTQKVEYFAELIGRELKNTEPGPNIHNPLCVGLVVNNFSPKNQSKVLSDFIFELVQGIELYKIKPENDNAAWDKLLFYIITKTEPLLQDENCFSDESSQCVMDMFRSRKLSEPVFKYFNKMGFVKAGDIVNWLIELGDEFDNPGFKKFKTDQLANEHFPPKNDWPVHMVLEKLADEIKFTEPEKNELFEILFFK